MTIGWSVLLAPSTFGDEVFLGTDQLLRFQPWRAELDRGQVETNAPVTDTYDVIDPMRGMVADGVRSGREIEWNPYPSGGAPLATDPLSGFLGPFITPWVALPQERAPAVGHALEVAAGVAFTALLLRRLGSSRTAAVIGGGIYSLTAFQLVWSNWPQTRVGALIPALLWASERFLQRPSPRAAIPPALALAAMLFEGFPAVVAYSLYALVPYALVRAWLLCRPDLRSALRRLVGLGAALGLGLALTAYQVLPFLDRLSTLELERAQTPDAHIDPSLAITAIAPSAYGSTFERSYFGRSNYIETLSYVGVAAVALGLVALVFGRPRRVARGALPFTLTAAAVTAALVYVGGPILGFAQNFPVIADNTINRARSILGIFAAILAALGADALLQSDRSPGDTSRWGSSRHWLGWGAVAAAAALAVALAARALSAADDAGRLADVREHLLAVGVLAAVALALVLVARRVPRWRGAAVVALGVMAFGQGLVLADDYLPRADLHLWYPSTQTHEFLSDHLDHERVATGGLTMLAGSTIQYDLRTVTGHVFTQETWKEALLAADPAAFSRGPTNSFLSERLEVARSPVLDRLGARFFTVSQELPPFGVTTPPGPGTTSLAISGDETADDTVPGGGLRAVTVPVAEPLHTDDPGARLLVEIIDPGGSVLARGFRAIDGELPAGSHHVPVAPELPDSAGPVTVRVGLHAEGGSLGIAADDGGEVPFGTVTAGDEPLRLAFAGGAQVYERLDALPRIRWAGRSLVERDAARRLAQLAAGLPADVVMLDAPAPRSVPTGQPADAKVDIVRDGPDDVVVDVSASGDGYLVVADALQHGWSAEVDGERAELRHADHAGVAVAVDEGDHRVVLRYQPNGQRVGLVISIVATLVIAALLLNAPARAQRLRARREGELARA